MFFGLSGEKQQAVQSSQILQCKVCNGLLTPVNN